MRNNELYKFSLGTRGQKQRLIVKISEKLIFTHFSKEKNIEYHPFVTRENLTKKGIGNERISSKDFNKIDESIKHEIYICGSDSFVENSSDIVKKIFLKSDIYTERFGS